MKQLNSFYYRNELYIRLIPSKALFRSTLVHEVVNRGDVFAMRVSDQQFTVVPGKAQVTHTKIDCLTPLTDSPAQASLF
jgi:hypothetical protein